LYSNFVKDNYYNFFIYDIRHFLFTKKRIFVQNLTNGRDFKAIP
jgi:hypothetical protein